MADNSYVKLWVEGDCFTFSKPKYDRPGDSRFLFTRVGLVGVDRIDAKGYSESSLLTPAGNKDAPFGRRLDLCGWFGETTDVTHYRIQYGKQGGIFKDITEPLSNKYYQGGGKWVTVSMGPQSLGGQSNLYTTPYLLDKAMGVNRPWQFPDLLARWDTSKADGDGLYTLRILGYKWSGSTLSAAGSLVIDPFYGQIKLQIDNTPPEVKIMSIVHVSIPGPGASVHVVKPCDIVDFKIGDSLRVYLRAYDGNGHLGGYRLDPMYGDDCRVNPRAPGSYRDYQANASQKWSGGNYITVYKASDYGTANGSCVAGNMPTCAYQFRLGAWKRTTNGYGRIYPWVEDAVHVTINRV
jgi:hypothetical protein